MKVKILRQSMNPVKDDKLNAMVKDYQKSFDGILEECGADMQAVHTKVEELLQYLQKKYKDDMELEIDMPKSGKQWKALIEEHGVISVGTHVETGKVCFIIMDSDDSGLAF